MTKITVFLSGGDWTDASVEHLVLAEGTDLSAEQKKYDAWYRNEYLPRYGAANHETWMSFVDWLQNRCDARLPNDDELWEKACRDSGMAEISPRALEICQLYDALGYPAIPPKPGVIPRSRLLRAMHELPPLTEEKE